MPVAEHFPENFRVTMTSRGYPTGYALWKAMRAAGYTVTERQIYNYLAGINAPTIASVEKFATFLDVEAAVLCGFPSRAQTKE